MSKTTSEMNEALDAFRALGEARLDVVCSCPETGAATTTLAHCLMQLIDSSTEDDQRLALELVAATAGVLADSVKSFLDF